MNTPYPYQPFPKPLPPVPSDNLGPFCLEIDGKWIPYLLGAVSALAVEQTWRSDVSRCTGEARNLLETLMEATACQILPVLVGGSEDCMDCCLRVENGHLQQLGCGVWKDIPGGDLTTIVQGTSTQPGNTTQPAVGTCVDFAGTVNYGSRWLLPFQISEGDVIHVVRVEGATSDYTFTQLLWRCGDGNIFLGGVCVDGSSIIDSLAPMPTAPQQALIGYDGVNYYDFSPAASFVPVEITIPSGISNGNFTFLVNDEVTFGAGNLSFGGQYCKASNVVTRFTHVFDLRESLDGMDITVPGAAAPLASWIPGTGVQVDNPSGLSAQGSMRIARATPRTLHNVTVRVLGDVPTDLVGSNGIYNVPASDPMSGAPSEYYLHPTAGPLDFSHAFVFACDAFRVEWDATPHPSTSTISQIIISADGDDPF